MENINIASFSEANTATVKGIWQYDFGQILRIEGLGLPDAVEVHFSLQKTGGYKNGRNLFFNFTSKLSIIKTLYSSSCTFSYTEI